MNLEAITGQRTTPILVELKGHAQRIHGYESSVLRSCFKIGQELLAARELIRGNYAAGEQDGMWLRWLKDDVHMSDVQAGRFIHVYAKYGAVYIDVDPLPRTTFTVLAELAAPGADPEVVKRIEDKIAVGESPTVSAVREAKKAAKTTALVLFQGAASSIRDLPAFGDTRDPSARKDALKDYVAPGKDEYALRMGQGSIKNAAGALLDILKGAPGDLHGSRQVLLELRDRLNELLDGLEAPAA